MKFVINGTIVEVPVAHYTFSSGLTDTDGTISVTKPIRGVFTQEEFDALPEEEKNSGMCVVDDGAEDSGGSSSSTASSVPKGTIVAWYPQDGVNVPDGWAICDGTNGTPDLQGRFILGDGYNEETDSVYVSGETGGEKEVALTVAQMPAHTHSFRWNNGDSGGSGSAMTCISSYLSFVSGKYYERDVNTNTGGSKAHNNMPPYYVLVYIMKL